MTGSTYMLDVMVMVAPAEFPAWRADGLVNYACAADGAGWDLVERDRLPDLLAPRGITRASVVDMLALVDAGRTVRVHRHGWSVAPRDESTP